MKNYDVVIIGAGTAGLSAQKIVSQLTSNYRVFDKGDLGTTCARVGCMPSKILIQVAHDYHRRLSFSQQGILATNSLTIDSSQVMNHIRKLRERFVQSVMKGMESWREDHLITKAARFINNSTLDLGDEIISSKKIIIATGSSPIIPEPWQDVSDLLIDTNHFFELPTLPKSLAVIGLGVIGIELGQALHRLGVEVVGIGQGRSIAGLSDPKLIDYTADILSQEMKLDFSGVETLKRKGHQLLIQTGKQEYLVEKALVCVGRKPNLTHLGLENLNVKLDESGIPAFNLETFQLAGEENIFIAGDVNGSRPILHEAADQGSIAGFNATQSEVSNYHRKVWLGITFSSPQIATIGKSYQDLVNEKVDFKYGEVSFEGQGRSIIMLEEKGHLRVYGDNQTNLILGAELFTPAGEHLAHLLCWLISQKMTVREALLLPYYHPTIEEGLRTALRDLASKLGQTRTLLEAALCQDHDTNEAT